MMADALSEAVDWADLPALVAEFFPDSGAQPGRAGPVKCVWRGELTPSGSLHKNDSGVWMLTDQAEGKTYTAHHFLVQVAGQQKGEAAALLKARAGLSGKGGGTIPQRVPPRRAPRPVVSKRTGRAPETDEQALKTGITALITDGLPTTLTGRGLSVDLLASLWIGRRGEAALIGIHNASGELVAVKRRNPDGPGARYGWLSSGGGNPAWHSAGFMEDSAALIVEGELNAVACWKGLEQIQGSGAFGTVGLPGAKGEPDWEALRGRPVWILTDDDAPGRAAAQRLETEGKKRGLDIRLLPALPDTLDACEYAEQYGLNELGVWLSKVIENKCSEVTSTGPLYSTKKHALTDLGNADRFAELQGQDTRYCYRWNAWLLWDGARWGKDEGAGVERLAKVTMRSIHHEAAHANDDKAAADLAKHAVTCQKRGRVLDMLALARSELPITPDELDIHPMLLNVQNGTLDLQTGTLGPHARDNLLTKLIPVPYRPGASCPIWEAFLLRVMGDRPHLVDFLRRAVGYTLTGRTDEQCLFLMYGTGANGKSTFLDTLGALLAEYSTQSDFETFEAKDKSGGGASSDLARLAGARLVMAVEAESGRRLAESRIKQITGGDVIAARFLFSEYFEYKPQFKLFLAANHKPEVRNNDEGIWRRIKLIPFEAYIAPEERDSRLMEKLRVELPGILAWAVRGCLEWQAGGLATPPEVEAATANYRDENDVLGGFIEGCCVQTSLSQVRAGDLFAAYDAWREENGERQLTATMFGRKLSERGLIQTKERGARWWRGIGLKEDHRERA